MRSFKSAFVENIWLAVHQSTCLTTLTVSLEKQHCFSLVWDETCCLQICLFVRSRLRVYTHKACRVSRSPCSPMFRLGSPSYRDHRNQRQASHRSPWRQDKEHLGQARRSMLHIGHGLGCSVLQVIGQKSGRTGRPAVAGYGQGLGMVLMHKNLPWRSTCQFADVRCEITRCAVSPMA